jgi:hypothetical protein
MRHPSAGELVASVKSFIWEQSNGKNPRKLSVAEYERLIQDFLVETTDRLAGHELWRDASQEELDDAAEGLEKYLMNKMYKQCFQPSTSDDIEREEALSDRLRMFSWIKPRHMDIPESLCTGEGFVQASQELCKIDSYKAPRDKMICVLNSCKIINSLLTNSTDKAVGADEFFPLLAFIVIAGRPPNLYSNLQFIRRFRNPDKLNGEAGYYFTTLNGAVEFAQSMGLKELTIEPDEFERELTQALATPVSPAAAAGGARAGGAGASGTTSNAAEPLISLTAPVTAAAGGGDGETGQFSEFVSATSANGMGSLVDLSAPAVDARAVGNSAGASRTLNRTTSAGVFGEDTEVLRALNEPLVAKFVSCNVEDLTMVDIPLLLADYKRVATMVGKLQTFFKQQGFEP